MDEKIRNLVKYLINEYEYNYYFSGEEIKNKDFFEQEFVKRWDNEFLQEKIKNPIIIESGEAGFNGVQLIAFGGCIGKIDFDDVDAVFSLDEKKKIREFTKYLSPNPKYGEKSKYYEVKYPRNYKEKNIDYKRHDRYILPDKFMSDYPDDAEGKPRREQIEKMLKNKKIETFRNKNFLDMVICAAYIRFMRRTHAKITDLHERSIQSIIARKNYNLYYKNNIKTSLVVIDVEYKHKIKNQNEEKTPSVDFVVFDRENKSIGLIEFKYQGKSMNKEDKNSLKDHNEDFQDLLGAKSEVLSEIKTHIDRLSDCGVISDLLNPEDELCELWCGFYFVSDNDRKSGRKIDNKFTRMLLEERLKYDCYDQIVSKHEKDLKGLDKVRIQSSKLEDICADNDQSIEMDNNVWNYVKDNIIVEKSILKWRKGR
ncbi:MAG: hypothetical protein K6F00_02165 [Lachnospiraceae bacterium]|nr:hypothetical protein [Lachnospiraceae bacterium]